MTATMTRTVSTVVAEVAAERSSAIYGVMGNGNAYIVGHLTATGAPYVPMRHEAGTVAAAHAHALAGGGVATATTTYGAGFTNTLTPLAEARLARVPLVLIAGAGPSSGPRWWDVDQRAITGDLGIPWVALGTGGVAATVHHAYDLAQQGRTPVVLAVPYDLSTEPAEGPAGGPTTVRGASAEARPAYPRGGSGPIPQTGEGASAEASEARVDPDQVDQVVHLLHGARRPLLLLGRGAHLAGAGEDLREVGDRVGALFATSAMAAGLPASPWNVGIAGGFSTPGAWDLITGADVVLAVGISLNDFQDQGGQLLAGARHVIQVDTAAGPTHQHVDTFVRADAAEFAAALLRRLEPSSSATWRDAAPHAAGDLRMDVTALSELAADGRLDPRVVARRLDELLPAGRALVHDGGQFIGWMPQHARIGDPGELLLVGTALQTIGLGSASAVGAARARPERTTVLVMGDGGGQMGLADLVTFVTEARSGVVVVFNDAAYGAELHQYAAKGVHRGGMLLAEVDFAALGAALGARSARVRRLADLQVLQEWTQAGARGVLVLDVAVSRTIAADFFRGP